HAFVLLVHILDMDFGLGRTIYVDVRRGKRVAQPGPHALEDGEIRVAMLRGGERSIGHGVERPQTDRICDGRWHSHMAVPKARYRTVRAPPAGLCSEYRRNRHRGSP